jgi:hypothetical protein
MLLSQSQKVSFDFGSYNPTTGLPGAPDSTPSMQVTLGDTDETSTWGCSVTSSTALTSGIYPYNYAFKVDPNASVNSVYSVFAVLTYSSVVYQQLIDFVQVLPQAYVYGNPTESFVLTLTGGTDTNLIAGTYSPYGSFRGHCVWYNSASPAYAYINSNASAWVVGGNVMSGPTYALSTDGTTGINFSHTATSTTWTASPSLSSIPLINAYAAVDNSSSSNPLATSAQSANTQALVIGMS